MPRALLAERLERRLEQLRRSRLIEEDPEAAEL